MDEIIPVMVISRCIEFEACRWNGAVISSDFVRKLIPLVKVITPCPEKDIGLGVPRKSVRLVEVKKNIRMMQSETERDVTKDMVQFVDEFFARLTDVDGFILKDRSPSCGMKGVKVYPGVGKVSALPRKEPGLFGGAVQERFSHLPVENEGRLMNFALREHFLSFLYARARFRRVRQKGKMKDLVNFHSDYKYLFMAYNQSLLKEMGRVVANSEKKPFNEIIEIYDNFMGRLFSHLPRNGSVINVLMHCMGYFSKELTPGEKAHFLDMMEGYRSKKFPLSACQSILLSWARRFEEEYLLRQSFFLPYPEVLIDLSDSAR